jgi:hypothetical protein
MAMAEERDRVVDEALGRRPGKGGARAEEGEAGWVKVATAAGNDGFPVGGPWYFLQRVGKVMSRITSRNSR